MKDNDAFNNWSKRLEEYNLARIQLERRARHLADALVNFWPTSTGLLLPLEGFTQFDKIVIGIHSIEVWYSQPWSEGSADFIEFSERELELPIELLREQAYYRSWSSALGEDKRRTELIAEREKKDRERYEQLKAKFETKEKAAT